MKTLLILPAVAGTLLAASCASSEPETLESIGARAMAGCPAAVQRSHDAGDYSYGEETCECIAGRITTPLWSDETSSYTGKPMPIEDAKAIARAINQGETLKLGLDKARAEISVPSSNSVNTCFSK